MAQELTIQIVGWNSAKHLRQAARALKSLPDETVAIRYIDNASTDDSVAIVRSLLPQADIITLDKNEGFAGAHNIGFNHCTTPFVLTHDPDLTLEWSGLKKILDVIKANKNIGAIQGKLYRAETRDNQYVIDSAGIVSTLALNGRERGANEADQGQYNKSADLWAVTGACGLYRIEALQDAAYNQNEFFDKDFFAYKEDVDLGWRLNKLGWKVVYEPVLVGTHHRTLGRRGLSNWGISPFAIIERLRSPRTRYSLRNWLWMIVKNVTIWEDIKHEIFVDARLFVFFLLSIVYPPLFPVWGETIKGLPKMYEKRIMRSKQT